MNGTSLKLLVAEHGVPRVEALLREGLELGLADPKNRDGLRPEHFSIRELAEAFLGEDWVAGLSPKRMAKGFTTLLEAGEGVDVAAFSNITGQIFYNKIREAWDLAKMVGDQLVETQRTDLDGERMPWITWPLTTGAPVHPGMSYPEYGVAEEFIDTPPLQTYGGIISVHKLTIFHDRTGQILKRCGEVGEGLRWNKEHRILDTVLGAPGTPLFKWKGVTFSPYQVNGTFWSNQIFSNPLLDWTSFRRIEVAASKILEPDLSGAGINIPIEIDLDSVMVMPAREWDLDRILHATELRSLRLDTAPNQQTIGGNVVKSYKPYVSKRLFRRAIDALGLNATIGTGSDSTVSQADDLWFMWDSRRRPLLYMEAWPLTVVQQPAQSPAEFERDIVFRAKASERGTTAWQDPRMLWQIRGTAA